MRSARILAFSTAALVALAGCGGSKDSTSVPATTTAAGQAAQVVPATKINANTATEAELRTIPGVGEKIADEILEYRPYDAATGEAKFRRELAKYISESEIDKIIVHLTFG